MGRPYVEHTYQQIAYDPVSKRFVGLLTPGMWAFDPATRGWAPLAGPYAGGGYVPRGSDIRAHHLMTYDPGLRAFQAVVSAGPNRGMYLFRNGVWTRRSDTPLGSDWTAVYSAYLPDRQVHLVRVVTSGKWWKYEAVADTWTETTGVPDTMHSFDYDTANQRLIGIYHGSAGVFRVWSYDLSTNVWTPLPNTVAVPQQPYFMYGHLLRYAPAQNVFIFVRADGGSGGTGGRTETWAYRYRKTTGSVSVLSSVSVSPSTASVAPGGTQLFSATAQDPFGNAMSPPPSFTWTVTGGGPIDATGTFTAGAAAGGPFTVTATTGQVSGTATVTVTGGGSAGGGTPAAPAGDREGKEGLCGALGVEALLLLALLTAVRRARGR